MVSGFESREGIGEETERKIREGRYISSTEVYECGWLPNSTMLAYPEGNDILYPLLGTSSDLIGMLMVSNLITEKRYPGRNMLQKITSNNTNLVMN
jgi:hypothetical protein